MELSDYNKIRGNYPSKEPKIECLIDGNMIPYDACDHRSLEEAKKTYTESAGWEYLGSGYYISVNGIQQLPWPEIRHFFKYTEPREPLMKTPDVHIIGSAGVGKTALMRQLIEKSGKEPVVIIGANDAEKAHISKLTEDTHKQLESMYSNQHTSTKYVRQYNEAEGSQQISVLKEKKPPKDRKGGNNRKKKVKRKKARNGRSNKKRK